MENTPGEVYDRVGSDTTTLRTPDMKAIGLLLWALLLPAIHPLYGQLLEENFAYDVGSPLTDHGYVAHSGAGSRPILIIAGGLSRQGYPSSGIGNSILLEGGSGSREDVNRTFPSVTSGSVYASLLVCPSGVSTSGDYFFHLGPTSVSTIFRGRIFVKSDTSGSLAFGVAKSSALDSVVSWTPFAYATGGTYLLVLKYTFNDGSSNDAVELWVNPPLSATEPPPDLTGVDTGSDASELGSIAFRQGGISTSLTLDGVRIATSWKVGTLPIQLSRFMAVGETGGTLISWTTLSETNNYGFEVQKSAERTSGYQPVSGLIAGHGTTNEPHSYEFRDTTGTNGKFYRLKQIDLDQSVHYSEPTEAVLTHVGERTLPGSSLDQNYPNPFNPATVIAYQVPSSMRVTLKIYDLLGREVATLVSGRKPAGRYTVEFDGSGLPSGTYLYRLETEDRLETKRMILLR